MESGREVCPDAIPLRYDLLPFARGRAQFGPRYLNCLGTLLDPQPRGGLQGRHVEVLIAALVAAGFPTRLLLSSADDRPAANIG